MQLTPAQLETAHNQPQQAQLYLSFYQPETVFTAQVAGNITVGERIIPCGNISAQPSGTVLPNFVMMVGTTPGGNELGTVRVRNVLATGTILVVAENYHINWSSGAYLTVLNYVDVEAIYPRMVQTTINGDPINAIFYKDYDLVHTNQNSVLGSFVCMGPHRAAFRDPASGQAQLYWSSSGSYNVKSEAMSFAWEFEGGTPATSSLRDPGWVTYTGTGHFRTRLTVTTSGTASDFGYRWVSIYDRPDAGPSRPLVLWEMPELHGNRNQAGFNGRIKVWEPVGPNIIKDGALVVIFSDDYYGAAHTNLGGNAENCADIFWVGYVIRGTIQYDYKQGTVEFEVGSITEMMKQAQGFSVSCQDDANPDTWFKIQGLSVERAIYHYLRWHSTVGNVADFQYTRTDLPVQYFDSSRESIYDAIAKFVETGLKGQVVSDRQGKLWAEITPQATPNPATAFNICMPIYATDWGSSPDSMAGELSARASKMNSGPEIRERIFPEMSYVEYGGIAYSGIATGTWSALLACAPGQAPAYKGQIDHMEGMILTSQSQLNQIVGTSYAYQNSRFPEFGFPLVGMFKNIDIAPIEILQLNVQPNDTPRRIHLVNEPFHVIGQNWKYYPQGKSLIQSVQLAQIMNGIDGQTITIPPAPPTAGGFSVPGISIPTIPSLFGAAPGSPIVSGTQQTYAVSTWDVINGETQNESRNININTSQRALDYLVKMTPAISGLYWVSIKGSKIAVIPGGITLGVNVTAGALSFGNAWVSLDATTRMGLVWSGIMRIGAGVLTTFSVTPQNGGGGDLGSMDCSMYWIAP